MMKSATKDKEYKSPVRKLARFFEKSRDLWKEKYREAKKKIVYLRNRVSYLEDSREEWKRRAKEAEKKLKEYEAQTDAKKSNQSKRF